MLPHILSRIPDHNLYVEPFCGGAAVFWAKPISKVEIINDTNRMVINFYQQLKHNFDALNKLVQATPHSRALHQDAWLMYNNPHLFPRVQLAWAFWVLTNQGFLSQISETWVADNASSRSSKSVANKKAVFNPDLSARFDTVQIECRDALRVIKNRDREDAFFYIDPPYFNSDCGHYGGYTEANFKQLLEMLGAAQGKFLLSSYPSDVLMEFKRRFNWHQVEIDQPLSASTKGKRKTEVLTANYPI